MRDNDTTRGLEGVQEKEKRFSGVFANHPRGMHLGAYFCMTYTHPMRLVFMGTPEFAVPVLSRLLDAGHVVAGVVTRPDRPAGRGQGLAQPPIKTYAKNRNIEVLQPLTLSQTDALEAITSLKPEAIVVAAYGRILPREVLNIPPRGIINVHPSLLPRHRGPSPVITTLLEGDQETGVTIMVLDEGMDTGPILAQRRTRLEERESTGDLTKRLFDLGAELLLEVLPDWERGLISAFPQDKSGVTVTRRISKLDGALDWETDAMAIERCIRAFDPWPGCFTRWRGKILRVLGGDVLKVPAPGGLPGDVVPVSVGHGLLGKEGIAGAEAAVMTGDGALRLLRLQMEGRKAQSTEEFLRGHPEFVGSRLPS